MCRPLTHLSLHMQLAADGAHPSASASEKSSGKLQLTHSNTRLFPLALKQSAAEHHRWSQRGQAELKGWMAPRAIHYLKAEYLR